MPPRRPVSFVATADPEKAKAFYGDILGLKLVEATPFALVFADGENTLRVQIVTEVAPAPYTAHGWEVGDIEAEVQALVSAGVKPLKFEHLTQDDLGAWTTPEGHRIAWFHDADGNILSFTEIVEG